MQYGLIGERLGHSFSKEIHERLGLYEYDLVELSADELEPFLAKADFRGVNVTIPYKQQVIPFLDGLSARAQAIGAVNTIVRRDGKLYGDNTDFAGLRALIGRMGLQLQGQTVLIAGTGGTSRTAKAVAESLGAAHIVRLSRSGRDGALTYEQAYEQEPDADVLINTTPSGMFPDMKGMPVDLARLGSLRGLVDVIYNPLTTRLVAEARKRGITAENGLYMLVAQALAAAEAFTGACLPEQEAERVYRELLLEKSNIVLIGMPGCGKSTIGALLSQRAGRELADTDSLIVERTGASIPQIFSASGEEAFRDLESEAVLELSQTGGKIIAVGGGAILRQQNVDALKANGLLVFLDRPLEDLSAYPDRPLSDDLEKLEARYRERIDIYRAVADITVPVQGGPEATADAVIARLAQFEGEAR